MRRQRLRGVLSNQSPLALTTSCDLNVKPRLIQYVYLRSYMRNKMFLKTFFVHIQQF